LDTDQSSVVNKAVVPRTNARASGFEAKAIRQLPPRLRPRPRQ